MQQDNTERLAFGNLPYITPHRTVPKTSTLAIRPSVHPAEHRKAPFYHAGQTRTNPPPPPPEHHYSNNAAPITSPLLLEQKLLYSCGA